MHFSFYTEKVPANGEDSEPLLMVGQDRSILGVFDGMGGAGGTIYESPGGRHSGAWFASRLALDVVQGHLPELLGSGPDIDGSRIAAELHDRLQEALSRRLAEFGAAKSALRSKLLRALPTTMAVAYVVRAADAGASDGGDAWACHCFWAGDSRLYAIDPDAGAHQLTADDLRSDNDALENLLDDSVMDNCISADTDFHINYRRVDLRAPFLLVAATDGCFGYVPSPMHFEYLVLSHLDAATSVDGWRTELRSAIEAVAGDDATMALLAVGGDLAAIRSTFSTRLAQLRTTYIEPLDNVEEQVRTTVQRADELREQRLTLRSELWAKYKPDYERFLLSPESAVKVGTSETGSEGAQESAKATDAGAPASAEEPAGAGESTTAASNQAAIDPAGAPGEVAKAAGGSTADPATDRNSEVELP